MVLEQIRQFRQSAHFEPFANAYIEVLCVRSAAVMCVSEVEEVISGHIRTRISSATDAKVAHFVTENLAGIIKRTAKSDLTKTISMFGVECKDSFNQSIDDRDVTAYSALLRQRHEVAHSDGGDLSFSQLEAGVTAADRMIAQFCQCIA